jgi:MtN3 and saliva related transmembrane protein
VNIANYKFISIPLKVSPVPIYIELVGSLAAAITTLCWIPQIIKIVRQRQTDSISLVTNVSLALGVLLWLFYGMMISSWPVMAANGITLLLILTILGLKLRYG